MNKFRVSVIVPVYNASEYLDDCIKSVINQSYGFKNIELILVNDGSKDNSLDICNSYASKYDNILVINKKNSGVSDTRNIGFSSSKGEYIMFLDSDDLISKDSIKYLSKFLDENKNVDFVISRVRMFEKINKWHYMDYRFKDNKKFCNIIEDINYCQYHSTGILLRRSVIKNIKFDNKIKYAEDMKYMTEVLLKNEVFGIEKRSILYYRKRNSETSAVQNQITDKDFYIKTLESSFKFIESEVIKKYGYLTKYFQYYILNSLVERFEIDYKEDTLTKTEFDKYISLFKSFIDDIDEYIIMMQKRIAFNTKVYLLKLKNKKVKVEYKDKSLYINDNKYPFKISEFIKIIKLEKVNNDICLYYSVNDYLFKNKIETYVNGKKVIPKELDSKQYESHKYRDIYFKTFYEDKIYLIKFSIKDTNDICFKIGDSLLPYSVSKTYLINFNLKNRFIKLGNIIVYFKKYNIKLFKNKVIFRLLKYNYQNYKDAKEIDEFYDIFVKKGKIIKKNRKIFINL